jgi:hypothetical protein
MLQQPMMNLVTEMGLAVYKLTQKAIGGIMATYILAWHRLFVVDHSESRT